LTGWIALACEMLDAPDAAGLFEVQVVARLNFSRSARR
jgi:hypothetical protein